MESYTPFIAVAAIVALVLLFRAVSRAGEKMIAKQRARVERASPAPATILAIEQSSAQVRNGTVLVKLRLRLDGADGREVHGFWEVGQAHVPAVQPGQQMTVRVDADNPNLCFPTLEGVEHSLLAERMQKQLGL